MADKPKDAEVEVADINEYLRNQGFPPGWISNFVSQGQTNGQTADNLKVGMKDLPQADSGPGTGNN